MGGKNRVHKVLADKDRLPRKTTLLNKSFELSWCGRNCEVETTIRIEGKFYHFRSQGWTPPEQHDDITVTTESDYLTQREALEAKLFDLPSHLKPQPTIERDTPKASAPRASQIKKEAEETLGIYGSCLENDFIRAQLPCPETSDERLEIESPRYITAASTPTSRPSSPSLPSDDATTLAGLSYPLSPQAKRTSTPAQTPPLSRASSGSSPASSISTSNSGSISATDYYSSMPSESINVESRKWGDYSKDYLLVNRLRLNADNESPVDLSTVVVPEAPVVPDLLKMSRKRGRSVDGLLEGSVKRRQL